MKAKDLKGKNIEEIDDLVSEEGQDKEEQEDAVSAAYESLSKRLDSLRSIKDEDDEVKVSKKGQDEGEELEDEVEEELEPLPGTDEEKDEELPTVKKSLKEQDPLDDEESLSMDKSQDDEIEEDEFEKESFDEPQEKRGQAVSSQEAESEGLDQEDPEEFKQPIRKEPAENSSRISFGGDFSSEKPEFVSRRSEFNQSGDFSSGEPDSLDDLTQGPLAEEPLNRNEYDIPNLRTKPTPHSNLSEMDQMPQRQQTAFYQETSPARDRGEGEPGDFFNKHQTSMPRRRGSWIHLIILSILGLGVIGFTVYILKYGFDPGALTASPSPSPTATPTPSPSPEPSPEVTIERSNFTVRVLNGTSTSGLAGTVTAKLKELGYKTGKQGNADNTDYEQTEVRVKEGSESASLQQRLIQDLSPDYQAKAGEPLDEKSTNDAEVIIGKK